MSPARPTSPRARLRRPRPIPLPSPDLSGHPGEWKARAGYRGTAHIKAPPGSYNRTSADATLSKLLTLLQAAYPQPNGGMAYFTKYFTFSTPDPDGAFGYSLYVGHSGFYCTSANRLDFDAVKALLGKP
jgi:hypothetical protein